MKTKFLLSLMILSLSLGWLPQLRAENPFQEGVKRVELTPQERNSLKAYANNSKTKLDRAMRDAEGKPLAEANKIYLLAIKAVVIESYQEKRRSELLMRMALNQALELTFGVPTEDGRNVEARGVLSDIGNTDLLTVILEDSIKLALKYYQDDREAIEKGTLINLPYITFAQTHLNLGKTWLSSVNEWSLQFALSKALLEQWQTTVLQEDHMSQVRIAEAILDVEDALKQIEDPQYAIQQKVRFLRGVVGRTLQVAPPAASIPGGSTGNGNLRAENISDALFVKIPRGTFLMGSPSSEANRESDEGPQHEVTISRDFEMQATTVTQAQWVAVMGKNPSYFKDKKYCPNEHKTQPVAMCPNHPVEQVSFDDAQIFISRINGKDQYNYRLPTEAEWEYAARGGTQAAYSFGDNPALLIDYGWYNGNSGDQTHPVATKKPNGFGLYDMHGNVWQWVQDLYSSYERASVTDPLSTRGSFRVIRSGGWGNGARNLRSADRGLNGSGIRNYNLGFRLVRTR